VIVKYANYLRELTNLLVALEGLLTPNPHLNYLRALGFRDGEAEAPNQEVEVGSHPVDAEAMITATVVSHLDLLESQGKELGLMRVLDRVVHIRKYLASSRASRLFGDLRIKDEIRVLREALHDDLEGRPILFPDVSKYRTHYYKPQLFGADVFERFPDARNDVVSAGNCYATDNDTACVLHCFRVAEYGLKGLAGHLWKRKSNLSRSRAIEIASWGVTIGHLRASITEMNTPRSGDNTKCQLSPKKRKKILDFYSTALDSCAYFNQIRVDAAHVYRKGFSAPEALAVMTRVEEFMRFLVKNGVKLPPRLPESVK
jgi:hypothetical protein